MADELKLGRRGFGGLLAGFATFAALDWPRARAAAPDGGGTINAMLANLRSAKSLSFTAETSFGASMPKDGLKTPGSRASVVFQRPDRLFAVFGAGGEPDVQMLASSGQATLLRLSLAAKAVVKLAPERGAAFAVPGLFIPFLGLLADDPAGAFFGSIQSVTPIAQGLPDQPEQTVLAAVTGDRFTGEVWVDIATSLPTRIIGTWFGSNPDVTVSAAVNLTGWSTEAPVAGVFAPKGLDTSNTVELDGLGL